MCIRDRNGTAVLLEQLAARLNPHRNKVEDARKSLGEVIRQRQTIVDDPRELVRHFPAIQTKLERLRELTADITVEDIECLQSVDFIPTSLSDWIPLDSVNLVGVLTPSTCGLANDSPPTLKQLKEQLEATQRRESSLLMELAKTKEQQMVAVDRFSEQTTLHKQRDTQLCQYIEVLRTKLAQIEDRQRTLTQEIEIAAVEKTVLEKRAAAQGEQLIEATRRISELTKQVGELKDQINAGELCRRDLEERLMTETKWRRNAEAESRERRHQNEDLITRLGEDHQRAERRYDELQDKMAMLLKTAKEQARQAAWSEAMSHGGTRPVERVG